MIQLKDKSYSESEIELMDIAELNKLMYELQREIHLLASEKNSLSTLPINKKNEKTLNRVTKLSNTIMELQDTVNYISALRKIKRDTQVAELNWYRKFYELCEDNLKKKLLSKLEYETTALVGYEKK